jgi:hypothetical protein
MNLLLFMLEIFVIVAAIALMPGHPNYVLIALE